MDDMPPHSGIVRDPLVYLVEDDAAVRNALALLVRSFGWRVDAFANGEQFLTQAPRPWQACVVLDLLMPGLDGEAVLQLLRARGSPLPVLVITGDRDGPRLERLRRSGVAGVLLKPFGAAAFQEAVGACLNLAPT